MTQLTEAEKIARYDAARLSPITTPADDAIEIEIAKECDRIIAEHRAAEQALSANNGEEPFGTLRDGTPVIGTFDRGDPTGRAGIVHAQWGDWYVSADDDGHISFIADDGSFQSGDDLTMIGLAQVRALLATDVLDQISTAAYAYGRGDLRPVADTPADTDGPIGLQIERHTHMPDGSPVEVDHQWTTYTLGEAEIDINDAGGGSICIDREMLEFDENAQMLDLYLLLSNETVLEALDPTRGRTA
jgi:hypothetical protein